ncbi:MAG: phage holin family protein [Caulobacterales bacterium]|nr:phage holin family protein [Caulobacterales bacterium]
MQAERTLPQLTADLASQVSDLFRHEVRLARAEALENVRQMGGGIVRATLGVALAGAAVTLGLFALAYALGEIMPMWAAALVGAVLGGGIAYILIKTGLKAASVDAVSMPRTQQQVAADLRLIKENITP